MDQRLKDKTVCVTCLGYVGLPLAVAYSKHPKITGFDVDSSKIKELYQEEYPVISFTDDSDKINNADITIITVPTSVTKSEDPDLSYIESAARTIRR